MRYPSPQEIEVTPGGRVPEYLTTKHRELTFLSWWYRIASPPTPPDTASFQERTRFHRGRTGSQLLPVLYLFLIVSLPTGFFGTAFSSTSTVSVASFLGISVSTIVVSIAGLLALVVATIFNRKGMVDLAGGVVVVTFMASPMANIVLTPGGLNMIDLLLYGLLVLPLVCAVSFLPPIWVFVVAGVNSVFAIASLLVLPQTAELNALLTVNFAGVVTPIILSQLIVSIMAYLWVRSTMQALQRADRAEELAKLEHDLALQAEMAAQQKHQLEMSIHQIIETHRRVANGDYDARVPLSPDNILWEISGSLNNLLARVQGWRRDAAELQQVKFALQQAYEENRRLQRALRQQ
jgi:hypothetical protein